jgi:hypothetical protein
MHRPLRCLLLLVLVLIGCYGVGRRARDVEYVDIPTSTFASMRLSSGDSVTLVPSQFAARDHGWPIDGALDVGGRLVLVNEDSIVIAVLYVVVRDSTRREGWRRLWLTHGLPMRAIVRPRAGVVMRHYSPPRTGEDRRKSLATQLVVMAASGYLTYLIVTTPR